MIGYKTGKLEVIAKTSKHPKSSCKRWLCRCECGKEKPMLEWQLKQQKVKSCGCSRYGKATLRHGMRNTPEYRAWVAMKVRCSNNHPNYGARGIVVCEKWSQSFEAFYADMGPRPSLKHSLDRKDVNGNYEPNNTIWSTPTEQGRNQRRNRLITANGETFCLAEWAERTGIKRKTIESRLRRGMQPEIALVIPIT